MNPARQFGIYDKIKRIARYRLHIPMLRNRQPAVHVARGVMVGMIWAMTPFFGLHMIFVFITWVLARKLFNWDFSLVNGLAWTWTTNVLTIIPAYYLCYLTGQFLTGNISDPLGYDSFHSVFHAAGEHGAEGFAALVTTLTELWKSFGVPLFIGSAVWSALSGWVAYRLSYKFVVSYRTHRDRKMAAAKERRRSRRQEKKRRRGAKGGKLASGEPLTAASRRT